MAAEVSPKILCQCPERTSLSRELRAICPIKQEHPILLLSPACPAPTCSNPGRRKKKRDPVVGPAWKKEMILS
jgi:hypothetical protein